MTVLLTTRQSVSNVNMAVCVNMHVDTPSQRRCQCPTLQVQTPRLRQFEAPMLCHRLLGMKLGLKAVIIR